MTITTEARNATLPELAEILKAQQAQKHDFIVPATKITARNGLLHIEGTGTQLPAGEMRLEDLMGDASTGVFRPSAIMDGQIAERLEIPVRYHRRLRETRLDLYDQNVNGWLHGLTDHYGDDYPDYPADQRNFLVRTFIDPDSAEPGYGRALCSDSFQAFDHLDALTAGMLGVREAGHEVEATSVQLSETRMSISFACPDLAVLAPELLKGYRPTVNGWDFDRARQVARREGMGYPEGEEPVLFAGFTLSNGETGGSAMTLTPEFTVRICKNGLTLSQNLLRKVHIGGRLAEGQIRWSTETQRKNLDLIKSQVTDAVRTCLDLDFVRGEVAKLEALAGKPIADADKTVKAVSKELAFSEETTATVLDHFIRGGQMTAGGMMQAITAAAQVVPSPDVAWDMKNNAVRAMELAAA